MNESRTKNSFKNIIVNNIYQVLNIILNFVSRTVFIKTLGEGYLGINGLFTNILSILSLAELGVGTAMVYSMYKPIAENDRNKLVALIGYYKVLYRKIALVVLILGLCVMPALPYIVNLENNIGNIEVYYLLYLINSVVSYLLLYKSAIITASQKEYLVKKYEIIFLVIRVTLQMLILIVARDYMLYLIVQILTTILTNICKSKKAEKEYKFIKEKKELNKKDKNEIWKNIKSLLFYQIGNVVLNNTDNILISILLGTTLVGYYSNYSMIVTAISGFTSLIFTSIQSSLGNYNVQNDKEGKYLIYKTLSLISFCIYSFCSISMIIVFQDFIKIWIGEKYLLSNSVVLIVVFNYFLTGILYPNWCYRYTTELFNKAKYIIIICAIVNIILSIAFSFKFGIFGIFIATAISRITTTFWYEPYILYKNIFKVKVRYYLFRQLLYMVIILITGGSIFLICQYIKIGNLLVEIILKEFICMLILPMVYFVTFKNFDEFKFFKQKMIYLLKGK